MISRIQGVHLKSRCSARATTCFFFFFAFDVATSQNASLTLSRHNHLEDLGKDQKHGERIGFKLNFKKAKVILK